jgi:transposase
MSSLEETRSQFNGSKAAIKLGIDVHQEFYVVVCQEGGTNPKPAQRFTKAAFLSWVAKLARQTQEVHAVYEACGFGFGLQRQLTSLGVNCYVVAPQKLDERRERVKTDGRDAKALCLKLSRYVEGNEAELAIVRVPSEAEEQARSLHRQREQLVRTRKQLEAQGRSLMVNHGLEAAARWWKPRTFKSLVLPGWLKGSLSRWQPILLLIEEQIRALTLELQAAASAQARGLGALSSVVIDREVGSWTRFRNRRQVGSYTGLCPGEYSSGATRRQSCITKHGNPRLRAALVETAWRLVRFQPEYRAVVKWHHLLGQGARASGPARKKAIVAVARQLAVDLWRIRTGRVSPEKLGLI